MLNSYLWIGWGPHQAVPWSWHRLLCLLAEQCVRFGRGWWGHHSGQRHQWLVQQWQVYWCVPLLCRTFCKRICFSYKTALSNVTLFNSMTAMPTSIRLTSMPAWTNAWTLPLGGSLEKFSMLWRQWFLTKSQIWNPTLPSVLLMILAMWDFFLITITHQGTEE